MALDARKRQEKLAKQRQKDKARSAKRADSISASPRAAAERSIRAARTMPVYECMIGAGWQESGLAQIFLSRRQPDGKILYGVYLVDLGCLGLKSTFCNAGVSPQDYGATIADRLVEQWDAVECPPELAYEIIYGGIAYAAQFGFSPDPDFNLSKYILADREDIKIAGEVEFGRNGKPNYVAGPDDDPEWVISRLQATVGENNFYYTGPVAF